MDVLHGHDHRQRAGTPVKACEPNPPRLGVGRLGWVLIGLALLAAFVVLGGHGPHFLDYLPFLLILLCPLMHLFHGHGGHGHGAHEHHRHDGNGGERSRERPP